MKTIGAMLLITLSSPSMAQQFTNIGEVSNQRAYQYSGQQHTKSYDQGQPTNTQSNFASCQNRKLIYTALGAGVAAAVSKRDSYSWSIPVGAVSGYLLGRQSCY